MPPSNISLPLFLQRFVAEVFISNLSHGDSALYTISLYGIYTQPRCITYNYYHGA